VETNPYPDGVYPFEVTEVSHTRKEEDAYNYYIKWTPPADNGFIRVTVEMFGILAPSAENITEYRIYPPDPSDRISDWYRDFVSKKDSFTFYTEASSDRYIIIKSVDKFGNVSKGVKYEFTPDFTS